MGIKYINPLQYYLVEAYQLGAREARAEKALAMRVVLSAQRLAAPRRLATTAEGITEMRGEVERAISFSDPIEKGSGDA